MKHTEIHTDLVGPITPRGFSGEKYFFTFTDGATRETETYTGKEKSEWFSHLKIYYARAQTVSQRERPIHLIRTDFGSELRSTAVDQWMLAKGINFEPSAPYSQEENGIAERKGRTLMERVRCTIIGGGIPDELWPEILLAITHISNLLPTSSLNGVSPFEASAQSLPNLQHLRILGSTVYVFIHEEERNAKSAKWTPRGKRGVLVGYEGGTIYRVYLHDEGKVIRIKDLKIFENADEKENNQVTCYDAIMAPGNQPSGNKSHHTLNPSSLSAPPLPPIVPTPLTSSPEITPNTNLPKKTRSGRISRLPKRYDAGMNNDIKVFLSQLTEVLDISEWGIKHNCVLYSSHLDECDPLVFLTQKIRSEDAGDLDHYAYVTNNFDIQEPET